MVKVRVDPASVAKGVDIDASAVAKGVDIDAGAAAKSVDLSSVTKGGVDVDASAIGRGGGRQTLANAAASLKAGVSSIARAAGDALQGGWNSLRGGPKKADNLVDGAKTKSKPLPEAEAPKTKQDLVDAGLKDGPDTDAALKNADDIAKEPSVSRTLQKWGVRGGVGVIFLMMLYDTANPFEAIAKGAEDAKDTVKGSADILSGLFAGLKGLLALLTKNWMVSAASSCCCVLLILLPMFMGGAKSIAPRRPYY